MKCETNPTKQDRWGHHHLDIFTRHSACRYHLNSVIQCHKSSCEAHLLLFGFIYHPTMTTANENTTEYSWSIKVYIFAWCFFKQEETALYFLHNPFSVFILPLRIQMHFWKYFYFGWFLYPLIILLNYHLLNVFIHHKHSIKMM